MLMSIFIGFGIAWCLLFIFLTFVLKSNTKAVSSVNNQELLEKLELLRSEYKNLRMDEIKNLEIAYSRNPGAFKYDTSLITESQKKIQNIDEKIKELISKMNVLDFKPDSNQSSNIGLINSLGIYGAIILGIGGIVFKIL